jgi:hypothetical protein
MMRFHSRRRTLISLESLEARCLPSVVVTYLDRDIVNSCG